MLPFERAEIIANLHNCLHLSDLSDFAADLQIFLQNVLLVDFTNKILISKIGEIFFARFKPTFCHKSGHPLLRSIQKGKQLLDSFSKFQSLLLIYRKHQVTQN